MTDRPGFAAPLQAVALDDAERALLRSRLRRVQGQVAAVERMLDEGRDCRDIVHLVAAATSALNRAGFLLLSGAMRQCVRDPAAGPADLAAVEKLFLELS